MIEPSEPGTRMEYAVRYDAPEEYAGEVICIRRVRSLADDITRDLNSGGNVHATTVQREVTYGEWTEVAE